MTGQELGMPADFRSLCFWSVDVLCGSDESLRMWVILYINVLFLGREMELSAAGKAKPDSNRSSQHSGSHRRRVSCPGACLP